MKICNACKAEKPADEYYTSKYIKIDGTVSLHIAGTCKTCCKARVAKNVKQKWESKYKAYHDQYNAGRRVHLSQRKQTLREWIKEMKSSPCTDCGGRFPSECMDFDHRDRATKSSGVAAMVGSGRSKKAILAEIDKCDLVCANCHRIRTAKQLEWF